MFLSRIAIDLEKRSTMRALENPEILHGMIETCFPGERKRTLWRLDELKGNTYLLILSPDEPDFSSVAEQIGKTDSTPETRNYQPLLDRIQKGTIWRFRLVANPVTSVSEGNGKRGKIKAITITAQQREWLQRQSEEHGFVLNPNQFDVTRSEWHVFRKNGKTVSALSATYEGVLTVTDAALFTESLINGIGRGKAYGMGLLTVVTYG